ncbi:MAG TPA: tetratricopeptide repeat protein [Candidatus Polarisedimenticolia bacterium]|nr:tetratricopeptide repeat protein [Candidatus Polarisedimenticolia bacterium]
MDAARHYSTRDAARILQTTETRIRDWARLGGLELKGSQLTFQQLLLLRTTRGLLEAGIPATRVRRVWSSLRRQLKDDLPLTSVRILADGTRAVAWDESASWQPDSGQFLLDFEAEELEPERAATLRVVAPLPKPLSLAAPTPACLERTADQWFEVACELEETSPLEARQAYLEAIALNPEHADSHLNLGRLDHASGELGKAEAHYQRAVQCDPKDATAHFNLGVLLEDRGRPEEAAAAYHQAIVRDPELADAHYNLGLLLEARGRRDDALKHLMAARRIYEESGSTE